MWKIWLAASIAVTASFMTIFLGIMNDIRYSVILSRALAAFIVGGVIVITAGFAYEKFLLAYLLDKTAGRPDANSADNIKTTETGTENEDAASAESGSVDNTASEDSNTPEFSPFTTKNLDRVASPKS